ncbi:MAG TPA: RNA pyrophosphohydrolase [Sulfurimonas sp. UBA12504]|nr:MAG: RNA pyrophosphohydrolase [Sulfurimonas sp. GWF2_37_8]DAB29027.1 MAG TPA: RNA pyrophosphohydrolase [Sulfurimonas sp. UBA12504]
MNNKDIYRPNVAMIIVSDAYPDKKELFIAQRNDLMDIWQFPQGGIDAGEEIVTALFRELEEEIGTAEAEIVAEYPEWISYDFPPNIAKTMKPYKGQTQRYFLLRLKENAVINLATEHPEFMSHKFVSVDEVLNFTAHFKKSVYEVVINHFKNEGLL